MKPGCSEKGKEWEAEDGLETEALWWWEEKRREGREGRDGLYIHLLFYELEMDGR